MYKTACEVSTLHRNDLDKLMYLVVLAEEKNMTRAAERLFLSQPALTAYINRLESELGVKLFDRASSPIQLTQAGSYYIQEMEKLYNQHAHVLDELAHMDYAPDTMLKIGIGRNRGSLWLPYLLPAVYKRFPDAHIQVFEDRDESMVAKLINNQLDVAVTESFIHHRELTYHHLPVEHYTLITSPNLPGLEQFDLRHNTRFTPLDVPSAFLNRHTFICPSVKGGLNFYTQQLFSTYRIIPKSILFLSNLSTAYQLAVKGLGISYLASSYADTTTTAERPVFLMPGGKPTTRMLYAVYDNRYVSELKQFFIDSTTDIMARVQKERMAAAASEVKLQEESSP